MNEFDLSEENKKLFYHEYEPEMKAWAGEHRGIGFEIVARRWAHKTLLPNPAFTAYLYLDLEKIPPKYGPSSFWIEAEPWVIPIFPEKEGDTITAGLNKTSRRMNRRNAKRGTTLTRYSDHPLLNKIEFHGGITYYHREYDGPNRIIKVGCDFSHTCDMDNNDLMAWHPLPVDLNFVIGQTKLAIDSWYELVPEYASQ